MRRPLQHQSTASTGWPCVMTPVRAARVKRDLNIFGTSSAVSGAQATSNPPEVCGSVSRLRHHAGKSPGRFSVDIGKRVGRGDAAEIERVVDDMPRLPARDLADEARTAACAGIYVARGRN
jgi:hypothetical protein